MSNRTWKVGDRLHHAKHGYATLIEVPKHKAYDHWTVKKDKGGRYQIVHPSHGDRQGWHSVNSQYATSCQQCREGKS